MLGSAPPLCLRGAESGKRETRPAHGHPEARPRPYRALGGDPIPPSIFLCTLQHGIRPPREQWRKRATAS
nr:hypothetical protein CFP56_12257 [Quercus suber]